MHIPDGFLSGQAAGVGIAVAAVGLGVCMRRAGRESRERDLPLAGLAAAFFLVGEAPIFPVGIGTSGHLLGGTLAVALLGPWLGAVTVAVVTIVQAVAFGDGGITTLGLGITNLALVPAFVGFPLILLLRRLLPATRAGVAIACGLAALADVLVASGLFVLEFALGDVPSLDLSTLAATTVGTYAVIGTIEGVVTALIIRSLLAVRPDLVRVGRGLARPARPQPEGLGSDDPRNGTCPSPPAPVR